MIIQNNRVKVSVLGTDAVTDFILGDPIESFVTFPNGSVTYTALADTGEWQVATGTVTGLSLTRGIVEENYLGTTDQVDFSGKTIQIAQTISADYLNTNQLKLDGIEEWATADQDASEIKILYESNEDTNAFTDGLLIKLNNIQDGATDDLTNEEIKILYESNDDTNNFNDLLLSKLENIEFMATADQIALEVPFDFSAEIPETNVQGAIENVDEKISNHTQEASTIIYNPADDPTSVEINVQNTLVDHGVSIEQRVASCTGIISGGKLTATIGSTFFSISAGNGEFLDSYSDPSNTAIIGQSWADFTNISVSPEIGSLSIAAIKIFIRTSFGTAFIVKQVGTVSLDTFRDHILIGTVYVVNGLITDVIPAPSIVKQTATDTYDLLTNNVYITNGYVFPVDAELSVWQQAGTLFFPGINWFGTNHKNPNVLEFSDTSPEPRQPLFFNTISKTGVINGTGLTEIPKEYDDGTGVIAPLPSNKATIHRLYSIGFNDGQRAFSLQYGQTLYDSAEAAKSNILVDTIDAPAEVDNMYFIAYICVSELAIDFSNATKAWIVSGKGGQTTSAAAQTVDHNNLVNRDLVDQHPIEAVIGLVTSLLSKMNWRGRWFPGTYEQNDVVTDGAWSMVANQQTTEQPSPQNIGVPLYGMDIDTVLSVAEDISIVNMIHQYTFTKAGYLELIQLHLPVWDLDSVTKIVIYDVNTNAATIINNPILAPNEWTNIAIGSYIVGVGTVLEIEFQFYTSSTLNEINGGWESNIDGNAVPANQQYNISSNNSNGTLAIDHTDLDSVEHTSELRGVDIDSIVTFVESGDTARNLEIKITSIDQTPTEVYSTYSYDFINSGAKGSIRDNQITAVTFHTAISQPSQYSQITDLYAPAGPTQPDFADVVTQLEYDGVIQADTDDGYGINIRFQEASRSDQWDILAYGGDTSGGSTGEGGDVAWGTILGDITSQLDLNNSLATKEPLINNKLTAFNKNFGAIADTACEGNDNRLSDARPPTAHDHDDLYYTKTEADTLYNNALKDNGLLPPSNPVDGEEWMNTETMNEYTWYAQGQGQWVRNETQPG